MALEGTIKDFGLPDIFQLIGLQRKTGLLALNNGQESVTVTFENGMVVMADSLSKRLEDRLGNVLVKQGRLRAERLEDALQTQRATLQRLGHVLVSQNMITQADLREALQVQISQIVFRVFRWRDGDYHFAPAEAVDYDRDNFTPMSADFILMEGIRMVDEWPIIEKRIPSFDIVFRAAIDPALVEVGGEEDRPASPGTDGKGRSAASRIRLTPEEERIFKLVDGGRTVQGVIDASGIGEFDVCRTLFDLLNRSIIAPVGRGQTPEISRGVQGEDTAPSPFVGRAIAAAVLAFVLISLVARIRAPFTILGRPAFLEQTSKAVLGHISRARLERIDRGVWAYQLATGRLPETLSDVVRAGLLDARELRDPWARPYHYNPITGGYRVSSDEPGEAPAERLLSQP